MMKAYFVTRPLCLNDTIDPSAVSPTCLHRSTPCIIKGVTRAWPAFARWKSPSDILSTLQRSLQQDQQQQQQQQQHPFMDPLVDVLVTRNSSLGASTLYTSPQGIQFYSGILNQRSTESLPFSDVLLTAFGIPSTSTTEIHSLYLAQEPLWHHESSISLVSMDRPTQDCEGDHGPLTALLTSLPSNDPTTLPSIPPLSGILKDIRLPTCLGDLEIKSMVSVCLWLGAGNTVTNLHYDEMDNLLCCVKGFKRVVLFPPDATTYKHIAPVSMASASPTHSHVTYLIRLCNACHLRWSEKCDMDRDVLVSLCMACTQASTHVSEPLVPDVLEGLEVILHEGDALYIPEGWWHTVTSSADEAHLPSVEINNATSRDTSMDGSLPTSTTSFAPVTDEKTDRCSIAINFWWEGPTLRSINGNVPSQCRDYDESKAIKGVQTTAHAKGRMTVSPIERRPLTQRMALRTLARLISQEDGEMEERGKWKRRTVELDKLRDDSASRDRQICLCTLSRMSWYKYERASRDELHGIQHHWKNRSDKDALEEEKEVEKVEKVEAGLSWLKAIMYGLYLCELPRHELAALLFGCRSLTTSNLQPLPPFYSSRCHEGHDVGLFNRLSECLSLNVPMHPIDERLPGILSDSMSPSSSLSSSSFSCVHGLLFKLKHVYRCILGKLMTNGLEQVQGSAQDGEKDDIATEGGSTRRDNGNTSDSTSLLDVMRDIELLWYNVRVIVGAAVSDALDVLCMDTCTSQGSSPARNTLDTWNTSSTHSLWIPEDVLSLFYQILSSAHEDLRGVEMKVTGATCSGSGEEHPSKRKQSDNHEEEARGNPSKRRRLLGTQGEYNYDVEIIGSNNNPVGNGMKARQLDNAITSPDHAAVVRIKPSDVPGKLLNAAEIRDKWRMHHVIKDVLGET